MSIKRTRLPEDFAVSPRIMEVARQNGWPSPQTEVEAFKDYHLAHGSLMADWEAAFRTWLRNAAAWRKGVPQQPVPSVVRKPVQVQPEPLMSVEERRKNLGRLQEMISNLARAKAVR